MLKYILILATFFIGYIANGQSDKQCVWCLPDGIRFRTQAQIDNFPIDYPNCTEIGGEGHIEGDDITNLNGLVGLTSINGYLRISSNPLLVNLAGLDGVISIGENLSIGGNDSLSDLTGLSNLKSVGNSIHISSSNNLVSLQGLENN